MLKQGAGGAVPPFMVMDVIAAANARAARTPPGGRVLRLEVGQPGTGAPAGAIAAAQAVLGSGHSLGYTEALGLPSLRAALTRHYVHWYGLALDPGRIAITAGASAAFPLAFLACFDPGDRIALAAPYYPPYVNILTALGMRPTILPGDAHAGFQVTLAQLQAMDPPPDGLILASPCNPVGTVIPPADLAAIAQWCHGAGVRLISDEIYHGLTYDGARPATAAAHSPSAVVINSFSKYFSMTGWRVGWMVLPDDLKRPVERLAQNIAICAPHISQVAAEAALDCHDELQGHVAAYRANRDTLLAALPPAWFAGHVPGGAFYLYADVARDSADFARRLLNEACIACAPGADFDTARGHRFVRFSYAGPAGDMREAAGRLADWLARGQAR